MAIKYTPAQQKAIDTTDKSILVSAAAGSGKTAVLVQRIIEMVCKENGPDIDKLLVVTFTNAAAAEMKDKIYQAIMKKIAENPSDKRLKRQLLLLPNSNIQTMHGFCLNVIKQNINMLNIPMNFRITNEAETMILKQRCIAELIEDKYLEEDTDFLELADTYGYGRNDKKIVDMILAYDHFTSSLSNPDAYFDKCMSSATAVTKDFSKSIYGEFIIHQLQEILADNEIGYHKAIKEIELKPDLAPYYEIFAQELLFIKKLQTLCKSNNFREIQAEILSFSFVAFRVKGVKAGTDNTFIKNLRENFKTDIGKFIPLISNSLEHEQNDYKEVLKFIKVLSQLTKEFSERYQAEKQKRALLDFSDFEHLALKVLSDENGNPSEIAKSYQQRFHEILIDEYQDTNDIQDHLFRLISKNGENLFLVGDVKQSIYGFRHAKPQIFIEKQETYQDEKHEVIYLSNNFRSRKEVVEGVNVIFKKLMTPKTGKTDYEKESLVQTASYPEMTDVNYQAEVLFADCSLAKEFTDEETEDFNQETLVIAKRIHQLIAEEKMPVYDLKTQTSRPANYGDIVILVRGIKEFATNLYKTLSEHGIPVAMDATERLFDTMEIKVILGILKAIDNPYDDLALLGLLKSPLFYWSEDAILSLRDSAPREPFFCALKKSETADATKVKEFLNICKKTAYGKKISDLINMLYNDYHLKELFCVYQNPEQRMENLDLFYQAAKSFDQTEISGLKGFLCHLDDASKSKKTLNAFQQKPPENAVRIVTMHKSKGLEYPIVFVSGLGTRFNQEEAKKQAVFHPEYGIGANYIDAHKRYYYPTLTKRVVLAALKEDQLQEELRILYVALTRAKEKLILTGTISNFEKKSNEWLATLDACGITKSKLRRTLTFIEWILPCVLKRPEFNLKVFGAQTYDTAIDTNEIATVQTEEVSMQTNHLFVPYHHLYRTSLPTKVAVTEANRLAKAETPIVNLRLSDLDSMELGYSQCEYGTYFHKVFELMDLDAINQGESIPDAIKNAILLAGEREYSQEISEKMKLFFQTDLAKEILAADTIYREKSFLVRVPAKMVYPVDTEDVILLQGVCDCYYIKNNEITLLDFKTDSNPNEEKIRQNYQKQLELYGYALEKIEQKKVVKKVIYTTQNQNIIQF
ncbi:MAG: helicase-exonuclease AddAB subunit AddA [Ruminococcaceae bacterium]|nr:helicase-exonuclease AddAB subunit AddA [Oscillospiraceae bacterium]